MSTPNREWETRPSGSLDLQQRPSPSMRNQSIYPLPRNNVLGDLCAIARRGWSRSADDLSKFPKTDAPAWPNQNERRGALAAKLAPIATNPTALQSRIEEYRTTGPESPNVDSPVSPNFSPRLGTASPRPTLVRAPSPRKFSRDDQDTHPFPTAEGVKIPSLSSSPKVPAGPMPSSLSTPLIYEETMSNPSPLTHVDARVTSSLAQRRCPFRQVRVRTCRYLRASPPPDASDHGSVPLTPINGNIPSAQETPQRPTSTLPPLGPPQMRSRSHSFTPRLSSKLGFTLLPSPSQPLPQAHAASPASAQPLMIYTMASPTRAVPVMQNLHAPGIGLPIPKRKGSGSSEHSIKEMLGGLLSPRKSNTQLGAAAGSTGSNSSTSGSRTSINLLNGKIGRGSNSGNIAPAHQQRLGSVNKLASPRIIEPDVDGSSKSGRRSPAGGRGGRLSHVDERRASHADQQHDSLPVGMRLSVEGNSKWTSQIVLTVASSTNLTVFSIAISGYSNDVTGWKPDEMVLTGTKLYFWKPPSGDIQAIRALFPTTILLPEEDTVEAARKITRGMFEALVHECVFATTFFEVDDPTSTEQNWEAMAKYVTYALTILLTLPPLAGRAKFENEFDRCAEHLVSGVESRANNEFAKAEMPEASSQADDGQDGNKVENTIGVATITEEPPDERSPMKSRVAWLASEHIRFHGEPKDLKLWDDWKAGTFLKFSFGMLSVLGSTSETQGSPELEEQGGTLPTSSSTQAIYARSPAGSPFLGFGTPKSNPYAAFRLGSPQLSAMISPNPYLSKSAPTGITRAGVGLGTPVSVPGGSVKSCSGDLSSMHMDDQAWALVNSGIEQALLFRDALYAISPLLFACSLTVFHRTVLQANILDALDAAFVISNSNELHLDGESVVSAAELFGCDDHPHWLTKLVLVQILTDTPSDASRSLQATLSPQTSSARSSTSTPPQRGTSTSDAALRHVSHTHSRSAVIERAELHEVEGWVYDPELGQVNEPAVTRWGGDARMREVLRIFETLRASFDLCPRKVVNDGNADRVEEDTQKLVACWRTLASESAGKGSVASKFVRVEQFMALSIATEPRRRGLFEPYYWSRPATSYPRASLEALMFPEPLPTVALIDRSQLARGRLDSDPGNMPSIHFLGGFDGHLNPEDRRKIKSISNNPLSRLNEGGTVIPVYNGELLLVVVSQSGTDSVASSRPSSPPPSSAIDHNATPSTEKGVGRTPSIRVKPGSSAGLDRKTSIARRSSLPSSLSGSRRDYVITEVTSDRPLRVLVKAGTLDRLVELLICGLKHVSVSVADDNGEMSLKEGMTRELLVDRNDSPREGIRENAAQVVLLANGPMGIYILGGQDILDDSQMYHVVDGFLISSIDHTINDLDVALEGGIDATELSQGCTSLLEMKESLITTFRQQTSRPANP
ncbi:hypothetical protein FISHEDRAFT_70320 [Fistulina hepatica ATCC 64428]|uniref:Uncharacterized protein n=1 Tax=Fistulina hepatica ATCC 64428 TaxID=1128425 RepID=A0A0D7AMS3_9AGAR|nr:hypothetical protein FISHEDRAFT_70320 [Fistulina hepatica ATCC 64428]